MASSSDPQRPAVRWGLTLPLPQIPLAEHLPFIRRAAELGYDDLWSSETQACDGFTPLALAAAASIPLRLVTGIVNPFTRGPAVLAQHAAALQDASGGRFVLGLGSSSNVIVEQWNGVPFERPLTRMRETVAALRAVLAGGRGPGGFKLEAPPQPPPPIVLAALRGKMLRLAAEVGDGAFSNFLPVSGAPQVVEAFGAPEKELACRFIIMPGSEEDGMPGAKRLFAAYATVPVYAEFFRWLGWGDRVDPMIEAWQAGDRARAVELVPEELVREIVVFGTPAAQRERLAEFVAAGVTTVVLAPLVPPERVGDVIESLAPDGVHA